MSMHAGMARRAIAAGLCVALRPLRVLAAGPPAASRQFAARAPQFTEEQLKELAKFDAGLAARARMARDQGVAVEWRQLDNQCHPGHWQASEQQSALGAESGRAAAQLEGSTRKSGSATSVASSASDMFGKVRSSVLGLFGRDKSSKK